MIIIVSIMSIRYVVLFIIYIFYILCGTKEESRPNYCILRITTSCSGNTWLQLIGCNNVCLHIILDCCMGCIEGMASIPSELMSYAFLYNQLQIPLTCCQHQCEANALNQGNQIWVCNRLVELPG